MLIEEKQETDLSTSFYDVLVKIKALDGKNEKAHTSTLLRKVSRDTLLSNDNTTLRELVLAFEKANS